MTKKEAGQENMKTTKLQLLREPEVEPSSEVLSKALGQSYGAYTRFTGDLDHLGIQLEWRYYTDGKAWLGKGLHRYTGPRGGQKETTAFWLSIWDGLFKVTVYIPEKAREGILQLPLSEKVKQMVLDSKQLGTKLRFFPVLFEVESEELLGEVYTLVEYKKKIK